MLLSSGKPGEAGKFDGYVGRSVEDALLREHGKLEQELEPILRLPPPDGARAARGDPGIAGAISALGPKNSRTCDGAQSNRRRDRPERSGRT